MINLIISKLWHYMFARTYINKVEIIVNSNQDPSRTARLTLSELQKAGHRNDK